MERAASNPIFVALFFIARCLAPLIIMLGISALLKKLGFISEPPQPPPDYENNEDDNGGLAHGKD
jgi:hypothetical protein